jgi:phenylacetate-coenzyme A ligase PaaK-like adenylate-forming protein
MERPLQDLPVLTKAMVMENFDELVTDQSIHRRDVETHLDRSGGNERFMGRYYVNASSGSTGQRGIFLLDAFEWNTLLASYSRWSNWGGIQPSLFHPMKAATLTSSAPWHQTTQVRDSLVTRLRPTLHIDGSGPIPEAVKALNEWKPDLLGAYPSVLKALAEEQLAGRLSIAPRMIASSGEMLSMEARGRVETAWGKVLYEAYGATETAILASECPQHAGMHLCEDLTIVEVVDYKGKPVPPGTDQARVLVTVLFRRAQPLIRYDIGDRVRLAAGECACGRPFRRIESMQGRIEETLYFARAYGGAPVAIHPVVFEGVLDTIPARAWQVVQEPNGLHILLAGLPSGYPGGSIADALLAELKSRGACDPGIKVLRVPEIPRGATGKAPLIRCNVPREWGSAAEQS